MPSEGIFDPDPQLSGLTSQQLIDAATAPNGSVVSRGRAILEIGRRAEREPDLQRLLAAWTADPDYQSRRWMGAVTLAWAAASALAYSLRDSPNKSLLLESLRGWPAAEVASLKTWARQETWFDGVAGPAPDQATELPVARTADEIELYMRMHPHSCGDDRFHPPHWQEDRNGTLVAVYEGACPRCGRTRRFEFALDPALPPPSPSFGHGRSRILDPGEFSWASDDAALQAQAQDIPESERPAARRNLQYAIAALAEVLKFIPEGEDAVPESSFTSPVGRSQYRLGPQRFRRQAIEDRIRLYRDILATLEG